MGLPRPTAHLCKACYAEVSPSHAYASVSMVDLSYLGLRSKDVASLSSSPRRSQLLQAQLLPFDGMNAYGLTIGMAAVPDSNMPHDQRKPTVGSLSIVRLILDHARNVDEAIAMFCMYNIDFSGGPSLHYLIADPSGQAATIELKDGAIQITRNQQPWQVMTNFYLAGASQQVKTEDWRYQTADTWLQRAHVSVTLGETMQLLDRVKQPNTQWSIVYDMSTGEVAVVMDRNYHSIHFFHLPLSC